METIGARFAGIELYFSDLKKARAFYADTLGPQISDEDPQRYAKFSGGEGFVCLERKGPESYPSLDKAALFFEVANLQAAISTIGEQRFVERQEKWAVLHDPEGHNVLLLQR
jgi:predicted enzyme related to lactoylglutathione lyase